MFPRFPGARGQCFTGHNSGSRETFLQIESNLSELSFPPTDSPQERIRSEERLYSFGEFETGGWGGKGDKERGMKGEDSAFGRTILDLDWIETTSYPSVAWRSICTHPSASPCRLFHHVSLGQNVSLTPFWRRRFVQITFLLFFFSLLWKPETRKYYEKETSILTDSYVLSAFCHFPSLYLSSIVFFNVFS